LFGWQAERFAWYSVARRAVDALAIDSVVFQKDCEDDSPFY
jgi:hypothetical protein